MPITDDAQTRYHVDSAERIIWRYRIGPGPALEAGEVFIRLGEDEGHPDGVVLDSDGCLWVALWDGWAVRQYSPDGQLLQHVPISCARVTNVAFGGPELRTVFVTSARIGLGDAELAEQPLAGSLFSFEVDIAGRPCPLVQLA